METTPPIPEEVQPVADEVTPASGETTPAAEKPDEPSLELLVQSTEDDQDFYRRSRFLSVEKDQQVLKIHGDPNQAAKLIGKLLEARGDVVVATETGTLHFEHGRAWVEKTLQIPGNVDFSTGNIDTPGDVVIGQNVQDLFKVKAGGSIRVGGIVEAAELEAAHDIIIAGGFSAKEKGRCRAGGDLKVRYIVNAHAEVAGDIDVRAEISSSRVICMGKLSVDHGPILSGHLTINGGVTCHDLGNDSETKVLVEVGISESARQGCDAGLPEIEARLRKAQQVRQVVEPLMQNQKRLTSKQKEQATELLYQASEIEDEVRGKLLEILKQQKAGEATAKAEVRVTHLLKPGAIIRVPNYETTIRRAVHGPIRVMARKIGADWQMVAMADRGAIQVLDTHAYAEKQANRVEQLLASIKSAA